MTPLDDDLALRHDTGPCRSCGDRRVLCAFGLCPRCHPARTVRQAVWRGEADRPVELCCGWWATSSFAEQWHCLTCGNVINGSSKTRRASQAYDLERRAT